MQAEPPSPPPTRPIPSEPGLLEDAQTFADTFRDHFRDDNTTLEAWETLCSSFMRKQSSEIELYSGVYRLVRPTGSMELMTGFRRFVPYRWTDADVDALDTEIEEKERGRPRKELLAWTLEEKGRVLREMREGYGRKNVLAKKVPAKGFRADSH